MPSANETIFNVTPRHGSPLVPRRDPDIEAMLVRPEWPQYSIQLIEIYPAQPKLIICCVHEHSRQDMQRLLIINPKNKQLIIYFVKPPHISIILHLRRSGCCFRSKDCFSRFPTPRPRPATRRCLSLSRPPPSNCPSRPTTATTQNTWTSRRKFVRPTLILSRNQSQT